MMQRGWAAVAGLLFLTACRHGTSNDRSASEQRSGGDATLLTVAAAEREAAARTLAAMRATCRDQIEMATIIAQRALASEVRDYATRLARERTEDLEELARLGWERAIDLRAVDADPMIKADLAAGRDARDRLARASGQELDMLYLVLEAPSAIRLSRLADQGEGLTRDPESTSILRRIASRARDAQARAFALMPRECGGQRDVTPAAAPHAIPTFEGPAGRARPGEATDAGARRPRGAIPPASTDL